MVADWHTPTKTILLTGAGFTKTFGGLLAREMWSTIKIEARNVASARLTELIDTTPDLDFEQLYANVQSDPKLSNLEKSAFDNIIFQTYRRLHKQACDNSRRPECAGVFSNFISLFAGGPPPDRTRGYFFTLNQDLFVEYFYTAQADRALRHPGLGIPLTWFPGNPGDMTENDFRVLPAGPEVAKSQALFAKKSMEVFAYVKLHGSVGWKFHDRSPGMVIGHHKIMKIKNEPLLKWYFSLFSRVLNAGDRNLLVIGYGFRDDHINDTIKSAIAKSGLRLFVIWPKTTADLHKLLRDAEYTPDQIANVYDYQVQTVLNLYQPNSVPPTAIGIQVLRDLKVPGW